MTSETKQFKSPNVGGTLRNPRFIIVHFTAGASLDSSATWLCNPASKASAHLIIGRSGETRQLVPFNRVAWHAGRSEWKGLTGLNSYSIGIELDNWGPLRKNSRGQWTPITSPVVIPNDQVYVGKHKQPGCGFEAWHRYTPEQVSVLQTVCRELVKQFPSVEQILGHSTVSVGRKWDPGAAFQLWDFPFDADKLRESV